jgi:DNA mismatch repair protein MutL
MPIRALPLEVVTKIAAGEVVERPASVVKELVENSLDAGATRIDIELEAGGIDLMRIVDDGHGIPAEEMALALAPHATSKITSADELFGVATLGFRGEALASIAGIAKLKLQSRPPERPTGAEIASDGGIITGPQAWGGAAGTRIEVRHLFFNVPVRKKFLKSPASELGAVTEVVTRLALAHPHVHFQLRNNGRVTYDLPGTAAALERVGALFGPEIRNGLMPLESEPLESRLKGFIGNPGCDRGNAKLQYFFVNGRWFRDRHLGFALTDAYRGLLMTGRHPIAFVFLEVPAEKVDVNVHPAKAEVKFREPNVVFSLVRGAVKERLARENLTARASLPPMPVLPPERMPVTLPGPVLFNERPAVAPMSSDASPARVAPVEPTTPDTIATPATRVIPANELPDVPALAFPDLPPGSAVQIHNAYIIQETREGMLVIDQHALHERILFEQIRRRVRDGNLEVQRLLIPQPIDLPPGHAAFVLEARDALATLGLDVTDFGGNTVLLSSYPTIMDRRPPHEILAAAVDELVGKERAPTREVLFDHLMATMACKAAVKAGDKLTPDEIQYLLQLRLMAEDSHHCPHGRPTTLLFSRQELDRQFRRI